MAANDTWALIGKKLSGEANPQELQELESLLASNESIKQAIAAMETMWQASNKETTPFATTDLDKKWEVFKLKLRPDPGPVLFKLHKK